MGLREYRARQAAEAAERRAALRQRQAEELIDFMLGDLRQKLDGVGRLDVLDAVGDAGDGLFRRGAAGRAVGARSWRGARRRSTRSARCG